MKRRDLLTLGVALPVIEKAGILDRDGQYWTRTPGQDSREAAFYLYGRMVASTPTFMQQSWEQAEAALRADFEALITEMHTYWSTYRKAQLRRDQARLRESS